MLGHTDIRIIALYTILRISSIYAIFRILTSDTEKRILVARWQMDQSTRTQGQLGAYLRRVRKAKGLTQTDLGDRISKRQATVSNLESSDGGATLETLFAVLAALDLELVVRPRRKGTTRDIENAF